MFISAISICYFYICVNNEKDNVSLIEIIENEVNVFYDEIYNAKEIRIEKGDVNKGDI